jgi:hypothetical protein
MYRCITNRIDVMTWYKQEPWWHGVLSMWFQEVETCWYHMAKICSRTSQHKVGSNPWRGESICKLVNKPFNLAGPSPKLQPTTLVNNWIFFCKTCITTKEIVNLKMRISKCSHWLRSWSNCGHGYQQLMWQGLKDFT